MAAHAGALYLFRRVRRGVPCVYARVSTPPALHARVHGVACIYLLHFLSAAINFRSTFLALGRRIAGERRGRTVARLRRQPRRGFAPRRSLPER